MNNHSKKIKISFFVIILLLMASIAGGSFAMKDSNFFTGKQVSQTIYYLNYKLSFAQANNKNLTAAVISIFDNASPTIENNNAKSIPVLLYHGIVPVRDRFSMTPETFKDQMFALKRAGYETITMEDFYDFSTGKKDLPDKSFLLTFDDGRKDSYLGADPLLRALGYNAVMFAVVSDSLQEKSKDSNYYLNKTELHAMINSGRWEIQSHGKQESHNDKINSGFVQINASGEKGNFLSNLMWLPDYNRLELLEEYEMRIADEFSVSKKIFQDTFGNPILAFSYPFGDYGQQSINHSSSTQAIHKQIGVSYKLAFRQIWANDNNYSYNYRNDDLLMAKRIEPATDWSGEKLISYLEEGSAKSLPFTDIFTKNNGWIKTWGELSLSGNALVLGSHASTTGSSTFLNGTYLWQNYVFKSEVKLMKGQVFSLVARYKNDKNYVICSFSNKSVRVEQFLNGERNILSELKSDFVFIGKNLEVGIGVYDDVVNCYLDGKIAMKGYNLDQELDHGGIGFKTWDPQVNNSELTVKKVFVEEIK